SEELGAPTVLQCASISLTAQQYSALPSAWISEPNQTLNTQAKVFIYRNQEGNKLFLFNKAANDSFLVKLYFDTQNVSDLKQVYSSKGVRIFEYTK
ncbi:MAG: hypothetical protein NUV67_00960, partial [archaeon]|nr:hypothetical protein [archaeon]